MQAAVAASTSTLAGSSSRLTSVSTLIVSKSPRRCSHDRDPMAGFGGNIRLRRHGVDLDVRARRRPLLEPGVNLVTERKHCSLPVMEMTCEREDLRAFPIAGPYALRVANAARWLSRN